jgi:acyl-CoA-binding protein
MQARSAAALYDAQPDALWRKSSKPAGNRLAMILQKRQRGKTGMSDIDTQFTQAQADVKQLPERPGNLTLLRLYALYKQASAGDAAGDKPGFADMVGKYKYDAWAALKGMPPDTAKQQYVELVESLKNGAAG